MAVVVRAVRIIPSERLRAAAAAARLAIDLGFRCWLVIR